jgi:hypothetical protein
MAHQMLEIYSLDDKQLVLHVWSAEYEVQI